MPERIDRRITEVGICDESLRFAIVDDITDLLAFEVKVDRRKADTAAYRRCECIDKFRSVTGNNGNGISGTDSGRTKASDEAVGVGV